MFDKVILPADVLKLAEADLSDDGPKLSASRRYSVASRTIARRENFSGYYERSRVRTKVLEEIGQAVEEDEGFGGRRGGGELVIAEA